MLGPVYNVLHDHHFREVISSALALSDMVSNKFDKDMASNLYFPDAPETEAVGYW